MCKSKAKVYIMVFCAQRLAVMTMSIDHIQTKGPTVCRQLGAVAPTAPPTEGEVSTPKVENSLEQAAFELKPKYSLQGVRFFFSQEKGW